MHKNHQSRGSNYLITRITAKLFSDRWGVRTIVILAALLYTNPLVGQEHEHTESLFSAAEEQRGYVLFVHPTADRMAPGHVPARDTIVAAVACELARNERESLQVGVYALAEELDQIRVEVDIDLDVSVSYLLPEDRMTGKEWFQPGFFAAHGTLMDGDAAPGLKRGNVQGFVLTLHATADTPAGLHRGKIRVQPDGKGAVSLDLAAKVHPFALPVARTAFGMYFPTDYWLPPHSRDDRWLKVCYEDMAAHSQNSVTFYYGGIDFRADPIRGPTLDSHFPMARDAGLIHPHVPCMLLGSGNLSELNRDEQLVGLQRLAAAREDHGWPELLNYGRDEPAYPQPGLRDTYTSFRTLPMRLVTAISALPVYGYGDVHDVWVVYAGHITPQMKAEAKRLNAEVWSYSCHMAGGRPPARHRYYAGLYTWAWELRGNFEWAYHWIAWWEKGDRKPRSTLSWAARRDGVDDFRYLQLLEDTLAAKPDHALTPEAGAWLEALRTRVLNGPDPHLVAPAKIHDLAVPDPRFPDAPLDFDGVGARAAHYIERLGASPAEEPGVTAVMGLNDEAVPFRDQSIEACIAGLSDSDSTTRRAAATALFERGSSAEAATGALISLLDDPQVRICAIRALEAIGPGAVRALPAFGALLSDPDAFVRLAAVAAIKAVALPEDLNKASLKAPSVRAAIELLSVSLGDDFVPSRELAANALIRCAPAAAPAVPAAIKTLKQPNYQYWDIALRTLAAIGPDAAPATATLAACYEARTAGWLQTPRSEALAMAAIGPAAHEAVPTLERFALDPNHKHGEYALYALYCIRGDPADLEELVNMMASDESKCGTIAGFLNALGAEAGSVAPRVQQLLMSVEDEDVKKTIVSFLAKVENRTGPTPIVP